jgi:hypothetical protein
MLHGGSGFSNRAVSTNEADWPSLQFRLVLGGALDYERFSAMDEKS